jgi:hypothetical protein
MLPRHHGVETQSKNKSISARYTSHRLWNLKDITWFATKTTLSSSCSSNKNHRPHLLNPNRSTLSSSHLRNLDDDSSKNKSE